MGLESRIIVVASSQYEKRQILYRLSEAESAYYFNCYDISDLAVSDFCQKYVITARKRGLGQGNIFTSVCLSTGGGESS